MENIELEVRQFSRSIRDFIPTLQSRYSRALRKSGFDPHGIEAVTRTTPIAAASRILARQPLKRFWTDVEEAGRELAKRNISPNDVSGALHLCDSLIETLESAEKYLHVREYLKYSTILAFNHAYHAVREEEHQTFYRLQEIEIEASNTDVLLRRFVEWIAGVCGADAAHAFLLPSGSASWELRASTAKAASSETLAVVPATARLRRALATSRRVAKPEEILDAGWTKRYNRVWSTPLGDSGVLQLGFMSDRDLFPREVELLTAVGKRCSAAARKTRLLEDIAQREEQLRKLALRMLMVEENERRRISRELHDDAGQSLVVIRLQMELIEQSLPQDGEERERLAEARDITEKTILDIRRLISDLSPAVIDQLGLGAALRQLANRYRSRYPFHIELEVGQIPHLETNFQLVIYRLAQECLINISQHSGASAVNISASTVDGVLRLRVEDNGTGFDVDQALARSDSFGLIGIRERVAVLGGNVVFQSTPKQGQLTRRRKKSGTVIQIELPIP